jgi:putative membrane protein
MVEAGSVRAETFKLMERRLLKAIMNPAMIASWVFGLAMLYMNPALFSEIWMIIKIGCVIAMTAAHMVFGKMRKELEQDKARRDSIYRMWNEVPTILMIIIVIMAVVEPI